MRISIRAMGQAISKPFNRPNVFLQSMPVTKIIALAKPRESMYSVSCLLRYEFRLRRGEQFPAFGKRQAKLLEIVVVTLDHREGEWNIPCFSAITL